MTTDWHPLTTELAIWRAEGRALPLWWRDDDAVAETPELARLAGLAETLQLPVHLAVIPKLAEPSLPAFTANHRLIVPVVHGWQHENHAPEGEKKAEFGQPRADALAQTAQGLTRLQDMFGLAMLPMFVPPWNRLAHGLRAELAQVGYRAVSTFLPRTAAHPAHGLTQINTHIDPIFWRGGRGLVPPDQQIANIVRLLQDRRAGLTDAAEPMGFLTHHLVHDADVWGFTHDCLAVLLDGGATPADLRNVVG